MKTSIKPKRNYRKWGISLGCLALVGAFGFGCSEKKRMQAPPMPSQTTQTAMAAKPAEQIAQQAVKDTFIYTPVGKRDPFKSFYRNVSKDKKRAGPQTPLQLFEIDQLKLIAVISGISQPRGMVKAPDGKGYTVRIGTRIGKNYGRVVRIKTSELVVAEDYRDWNGRKVTNYIHMALEKEELK